MSNEPQLSNVAGDYQEWKPASELRWYVRCSWRNRLRPSAKPLRVVPDGSIDIVWTGAALYIAGPDTGPIIENVPIGADIVGIRFWPGAARPWLGFPASSIKNQRLALDELWGIEAARLAEQLFEAKAASEIAELLERSLLPGLRAPDARDILVRAVLQRLSRRLEHEVPQVERLAVELGTNERTLRRYCTEMFGFGPKTLDLILRFQHLVAQVQSSERLRLADLASECSYADQAHLTRETRRLSGLTPAELVAQLA